MSRGILVSLVVGVLLSGLAGIAIATTILDDESARFEALVSRATAAAHVRVLDQSARFFGGRIVTDSRCQVLGAAFGVNEGDVITLTTLGGYVGDIGQKVFGLERPAPGDELALLLGEPGYMGGGHRLVGFSLGLYRVLPLESELSGRAPLLGYALDLSRTVSGPARDASPERAGGAAGAPSSLDEFLARAKSAHAR